MKQHMGKIIKHAIQKSGYSIVQVAKKIDMSPNNLYKNLDKLDIKKDLIAKIGAAIMYDFSHLFPEIEYMENKNNIFHITYNTKIKLAQKYEILQEEYNILLRLLAKITNDNQFYTIKKEIAHFLKKEP